MPAHAMQYGQEYQPQEPRQQTQQYQQYGPNVMYNMQQAQAQAHAQAQAQAQVQQHQQSPYGPVPTFRQERSTAAAETLASQFGEPQTAQYYLAGQGVPTSAPSSDLAGPHQMPTQYQQTAYAQSAPVASQAYPGAMLDPAQSAVAYQQAYGQSAHYAPQHHQPQQQAESVDQAFTRYQNQVRGIFTRAREGNLRETPEQLIQISNYLLGSAEALGLTRDDEQLHDDRVRLWDEFNRAWMTVLQRQHDLTQDMVQTGRSVHESQSVMSSQHLDMLGRELVRMCDNVEKHGLVDYQMGVAEEEIMDLVLRCLAILETSNERTDDSSTRADARQQR